METEPTADKKKSPDILHVRLRPGAADQIDNPGGPMDSTPTTARP